MNQKIALITGLGQDSSYLSLLLLEKNYRVVIATRRSGSGNNWRLKELGIENHRNLSIKYIDLCEFHNICNLIKEILPDEIYNLAAQSFVASSFDNPFTTINSNTIGYLNLLEAVRVYSPKTKIYFAGSSEQFGKVLETPQTETTPFYPLSPYGTSKLASYFLGLNYKESYKMFIANGLLFNHTGFLRGEEFVTRKITKKVAEIKWFFDNNFIIDPLILGNLDAKRDWGSAKDFVEGMWLMLQQDKPDNFILATGETRTIREFVDETFKCADIEIMWIGQDVDEYAITKKDKIVVIRVSKEFYRPNDVNLLCGNYSKAKKILGWEPKITFKNLVKEMYEADYNKMKSKKIKIQDNHE